MDNTTTALPQAPLTAHAVNAALLDRVKKQAQANRAVARAPNTVLAKTKDLLHFWSWARAKHQLEPEYPIPAPVLLDYLYDHQAVHSPSTLVRRLASLSQEHRDRGISNPCLNPQLRTLLKDIRAASVRSGWRPRQLRAATLDLLNAMLDTCGNDPKGVRDRALLLTAFSSGGRRPTEVCNLTMGDLEEISNGSYLLALRLTKTEAREAPQVPVKGRAAVALRAWLHHSGIQSGHIFRSITHTGRIKNPLTRRRVAEIIKLRAQLAGIDPSDLSGHSLRAGFMTEAAAQGLSLADAMGLSRHKTASVALTYYRAQHVLRNPAALLAEQRE